MADDFTAFAPLTSGGLVGTAKAGGDNAWKAPATGVPLTPGDAAPLPSSSDIADKIVSRLSVPRGPIRTVSPIFGLTGLTGPSPSISASLLNAKFTQPILGAPGILKTIEYQAQIQTTGTAAGVLQLFDGDTNAPLLRSYVVNILGATPASEVFYFSTNMRDLPFLNGIFAVWTPIVAAFSTSLICLNIDFESIPIGQRIDQSP